MPLNKKIWLSPPHMGEQELAFIKEAFENNWIAPVGPHINNFERELAAYLGEGVQVSVLNSGTAAIHLGLIILDIKPGDEVICQSFTFAGTANPIIYQGAVPVFVDSEPGSWNMCPSLLEEAIIDRISRGKKPKAIIIVHLYGMPANMTEIRSIALRHNIPLLEDAAEALGSSFQNHPCGTLGDISVLSFNGNKIITTSGGGALISANPEWIDKAHFLATQAREPFVYYEHKHIGYNYRLSNICAGIGRGQLSALDERVQKRRQVYNYYLDCFKESFGISFLEEPPGCFCNRWLTTIIIEPAKTAGVNSEMIRHSLARNEVESRPLWKPMHLQPVFKHAPFYGNGTSEYLFNRGLCLPSGSNLTTTELERITSIIQRTLDKQ